jgi:hypothetical protein
MRVRGYLQQCGAVLNGRPDPLPIDALVTLLPRPPAQCITVAKMICQRQAGRSLRARLQSLLPASTSVDTTTPSERTMVQMCGAFVVA